MWHRLRSSHACSFEIALSPIQLRVERGGPMSGLVADRRVFLSYAHANESEAHAIQGELARAGLNVISWRGDAGDDWVTRVAEMIRTSDFMLVLVSNAYAQSASASREAVLGVADDFQRRGIDIIPVLLERVPVPARLAHLHTIDVSGNLDEGVHRIAAQLKAASRIDFAHLPPVQFERLIADLLREQGLSIESRAQQHDDGVDLVATRQVADPFGRLEIETWWVQCKLYGRSRVSVDAIRNMLGALSQAPPLTRGLLVTNSHVTSVARGFLDDQSRGGPAQVRVMDGSELVDLLRIHPLLVDKYFAPGGQARAID